MANEFKIKNGLVVSGSADVEQNLTVNGILTAKQYNVSLISSSILFESGSTQLGNSLDDTHLFTGSIKVTGSISLNGQAIGTGKLDETTFQNYTSSTDSRLGLLENSTGSIRNDFNSFTSSYTNVSGSLDSRLDTLETLSGSFTGSFSGSFVGDGTNLFNIPASGVTGLNLTQIADGSVTASVSNTNGFKVNSKSEITGSLIVTNGITGSIDYSNLTNVPTLVSGSSQISITGTTGYSTFSGSISSSIGLLSSSIATTDLNQNTRLTSIETSTSSLNSFTSSALTRVSAIETSTGSLNSFTSSALTRVSAIETSTGSLNSFTSSINTTIKNKLNTDGVISGSVQVNITGTTGYSTFSSSISSSIGSLSSSIATTTNNLSLSIDSLSGSIAITDLNQTNRLGNLEVSTSSLNSFTSSINTTIKNKLNSDGVISGSGQVDITSTTNYTTFSSSIATTDLNQSNRLSSIETSTGSLNSFTSSINTTIKTKLNTENVVSGSSQISYNGITNVPSGIVSGSSQILLSSGIWSSSAQLPSGIISGSSQLPSGLVSGSSQVLNGTGIHSGSFFNGVSVVSGSGQIDITSTTGYSTFSSSIATTDLNQNNRLDSIETSTSSLNSFTSSIATTIKNKLNSDGVISGSSQISLSQTNGYTTFSSSFANTDFIQGGRLTSIESKTGSYATTGSNVFKDSQTISGSLVITQNLIVQGSSSIQNISSSNLVIGTSIVTLNANSPSARFAGITIIDSGSIGGSGSLLYDAVQDEFIMVHRGNGLNVTSSHFVQGPQTYDSLGNEIYLTTNRLPKSGGEEHIVDSNITDTGTKVSINSNTEITGSLIVAGGNKITVNGVGGDEGGEILLGKALTNTTLAGEGVTIDVFQNKLRIFEQGGNARGAYLDISTLANGVGTNLLGTAATASYVEYSNVANKPTLVSGSSQITFLSVSGIPIGLVSGSSQVLSGTGIWSGSSQLPSGVVSGSSQVLLGSGIWSGSSQLPSGVVSGSSQVLNGTTIHSGSFFNGISVVSGSSQISYTGITNVPSGLVSGSSQVLNGSGIWSGSAQLPTGIVSGSSQVTYGLLSGIPSGIVSGSSQVIYGSLSGIPSGIVSGSSQITYGSLSGIPSGIVSGSSQVLLSSGIWSGSAQLPSGVVSGSSQITLTSTQVTNGLGYTPYNATNPNGYISSYTETSTLANVTARGSSTTTTISAANFQSAYQSLSLDTVKVPGLYHYDGAYTGTQPLGTNWYNVRTLEIGDSTRYSQFVIPYSANRIFYRRKDDSGWQGYVEMWHSGNLSNLNQLTNGPGYITSYTETDTLASVTARGATTSTETIFTGTLKTRKSQTAGDYTTAALWVESHSNTATGIAFHISGVKGTYLEMRTNQVLYWDGNTVYHSGNLTNLNQLTNGPGYISSITSGNVTTALGYTPYNATNPSGYITSSGSISGNAATATNLSTTRTNWSTNGTISAVVGQISWKNYGNNHTIFDASASTSPQGDSINNANSTIAWTGTYPTLMGWNGTQTYGVRVDSARLADTAGALTSMNISQFTNNSGYITGISFANVSSKPTTISGYGITDAITTGNIGSQSVSYASSAGSAPNASNLNSMYGVTAGGGNGLKFWNGSDTYKIHMGNGAEYWYGPVTDYSIKCNIDSNGSTRGFTWGVNGGTPIAALNVGNGNMQIAGTFTTGGSILPLSNNSVNLGSPSLGWANVYTNDLHLSNMNKPEGNDVDGTKGTWTIQEGAENLYIINNNNGKKFKINLEEII